MNRNENFGFGSILIEMYAVLAGFEFVFVICNLENLYEAEWKI